MDYDTKPEIEIYKGHSGVMQVGVHLWGKVYCMPLKSWLAFARLIVETIEKYLAENKDVKLE